MAGPTRLQLPTSLTSRRGRYSCGFDLCLSPTRSLDVEGLQQVPSVPSGLAPPPLADAGRPGHMAGPHSWVDRMRCIGCGSAAVTERPERTAQGYRRFRCRSCGKQFDERTGTVLNRAQYPSDVIALVVLWRLRYKLSLRDLPEMFLVRGMVFCHETVREWEDHGARISGMDALAPIPHSGSRDADGLRAAELEHAVQGMDGHGDLGGLMTVRARAEPVSNHPLVAGDRYLGQSATMVA